jgi:hypothetical protein
MTKLMTVTDIVNTVRNPVFIPKIKKSDENISSELVTGKLNRSIFSGDSKRGTLKTALIRNNTNKVMETVLT